MKTKLIAIVVGVLMSMTDASAQFGDKLLGKLGIAKAETKSSYTFSGNVVHRFTYTKSNGKTDTFDTQSFYDNEHALFANKIINSSNPDMKKAMEMMELTIFDIPNAKAYNFMNTNGRKMVMAMNFNDNQLTDKLEEENSKIEVTKTNETKVIMGQKCDGYKLKYDKEKLDMIMWVSQNPVPELSNLGKEFVTAMGNITKANKSNKTNYMSYNLHPELLKLAKEGKATLGFTSINNKGEKTEMEVIESNANAPFTFKASDYQSML